MGFFSDPAAKPTQCSSLERAMSMRALGCQDAELKTKRRRSKNRKGPTRTKSLETTVPVGFPAERRVSTIRRAGRRGSLADSSNGSSFSSSRRSIMGDSSMGGSCMTSHLENIEVFCMVMQETSSADRDKLLRESLMQSTRQGGKKSSRRLSMA